MICLPTQMSRTQSGLWENDVYPSTLIDTLQEPYSYKNNAIKVQRFGTFGPTSVALDHSHLHSGDEFADMAFPQYFNTVQPDQLWRARSAIAFSPGNLSTTNRRTSNFNTDASSLNQVNLHNDNPPLPPPPHLVINSLTQGSEEHKRLTMANSKLIPTTNAVYDDVATSSTITVISRDAKKPGLQLDPHLPSLMEFDRPI